MNMRQIAKLLAVGLALMGFLSAPSANAQALEGKTRDALLAALNDERRAQAIYGAVMAKFGRVRPFVNIIRAEQNHEAQVLRLMKTYQVAIPENPYSTNPPKAPNTLKEAFQDAVTAEKENIAMYEGFLKFIKEPDIKRVFENLKRASQYNHLPAFQRGAR